jgi:hypothetical protein
MPKKSKLDIELDAVKKQEQAALNNVGELERQKLKLETTLKGLDRKLAVQQDELKQAIADTDKEQAKLSELASQITAGIDERVQKDAELVRINEELAAHEALLAEKKGNLDGELEEYAAVRKQEIKDDILAVNKELLTLRNESISLQSNIDAQKAELHELSTLYVQEQADVRLSTEEKDKLIADNIEAMDASTRELDKVKDEIRAAIYERDKVQIYTDKAREEHQKFLEYERKARKILDTKDRELQDKSAEISQANQFLQARRSFLPEL